MLNSKKLSLAICCGVVLSALLVLPTDFVLAKEATPSSQIIPQLKIEQMKDVPVKNDFSIGPTRLSLALQQGEEVVTTLQITSSIEDETQFEVGVEDFIPSGDPQNYTKFLGDDKSQFSSKEWFTPAVSQFSLKHGERIYLPIKITVPQAAESGDHYSSVFVKILPQENPKTGFTLSSRVGSLFLLRIGSGDIKTSGILTTLKTDKAVYFSTPVNFELNFQNSGDVHLIPSGKIIISDFFGKTIDQVQAKDWVVLRTSSRIQNAQWLPKFAIGRYTASAQISRGYGNLTDVKSVTFFVFPIKVIAIFLGGLVILGILVKLITSKFEIKPKKK